MHANLGAAGSSTLDAIADRRRRSSPRLGAHAEAVQVDLATDEGVDDALRAPSSGRPVDALALNAGVGAGGAFATDTDARATSSS